MLKKDVSFENNHDDINNGGITMKSVLSEIMELDENSTFLKFKSRSKKARRLISNPMDLGTIQTKLTKNEYKSINQDFRVKFKYFRFAVLFVVLFLFFFFICF